MKRPQTTQNKRRMITQQFLDKDHRQDSSTLAGTTSIGSPSQVTASAALNVGARHSQPLFQSTQYSNVLQQQRRTKSTMNRGHLQRGMMIMSGSSIQRPLLVATSSPFFQGNKNQQEISFDGKPLDHTLGFLSGAMLMNKDGELNDIGGNWLNENITAQSMMRGMSAADRINGCKRPRSSLVATRAHQAQVKQRLRVLSSNLQPQVSRPDTASMQYFSGADILSSQSRSKNNQTQTIKVAPPSHTSSSTYQHFPCKSPLARVQRRFDETLNCLEYQTQQAVQFDLMDNRSSKSKPGILSHEDKEAPLQRHSHGKSSRVRVKGLNVVLQKGLHQVDDSDLGHYDKSGLEVRRKKAWNEVSVVAQIKHMTSIELLKKLLQFERLGKKLARQNVGQTIDYNNRSIMNNSTLNAPLADETIFSINIDQTGLGSSLQGQFLNSSIDSGMQDDAKQELDCFVHKRNQTLLMKISQDRVKQQYQGAQKRLKQLIKANSDKDRQILSLKSHEEGEEIESLQKRTVLLISQLQKQVFEDLSSQPPEKEPYRGPLKDLLRSGPQQEGSIKQKSPKKTKSPEKFNKTSNASVSPEKEVVIRVPPYSQEVPNQDTVIETGLMPKIIEEAHLDDIDEKGKLKLKIQQLEDKLRERSDYVLSTGERMELVIDYRKYEATKIDQFQELIKKVKLGQRMSNQREVDQLLRDRRSLQLEAYRLSKFMQQRIDEAVKKEASQCFHEETPQ